MSIIDNLISYWKLDESSGNAVDSVGSNTLTNTDVTYSNTLPKINNHAVFNGTFSRLQCANNLAQSGNFSLTGWVRRNEISVAHFIFGDVDYSVDYGFMNCIIDTDNKVSFNVYGNPTSGTANVKSTTTLSADIWYHIALVRDGSYIRVYINGIDEAQTAWSTAQITTQRGTFFGAAKKGAGFLAKNYFDGEMDEFGFWSRALSSTEVIKLYNSGLGSTYPFAPVLTTETVTNIDLTSATLNGTLVNDIGFTVTEKGFVYSTSQNPTVDDTKIVVAGSSLGSYTGSATGLTVNTTYYVRSYATNSIGTGYGDQVSFTTLSLGAKKLYLDINGIEGETYTVSLNVGGSAGSVSVKLGSTSTAHVINAGDGVTVFSDIYSGLSGLIIESSEGFVGTVDDVFYVLVLGDAVINWALSSVTNVFPINSSVTFKRIEDKEITRFNLYRYLDAQFKDLDGYVTVTILEEKNDLSYSKSKQFLVGNTGTTVSPFVKKRISMLSKNQAILITLSNNKLNETFTICQYSLTGFKEPRKLYKLSKIISI